MIVRMITLALLTLNFAFWSGSVGAQQGPLSYVNIGGVPMHCTSTTGQQVAIYIDPRVNRNIGRAITDGYPTIILGPGFFNSVPPFVGQFWFLHECAHHVVGGNEAQADCFAIRNLRDLGAIRHSGQVNQLLAQISGMSGSTVHLPGPPRAQNIFNCLNS